MFNRGNQSLRHLAARLWIASCLIAPAAAMSAEPDPGQAFYKAREAYDAGRLEDAVALYRGLVDGGYANLPVLFNLGNAEFRRGNPAEAVYWYRRAQSLAPRDPDVKANLAFAWQTAGAAAPASPVWARPAERLSRREWRFVVHTGLAGVLLLVALGGIFYARRFAIWKWATIPAVLFFVGMYGLTVQHIQAGRPEAVVMETRDVLFAPLEGSTAHFKAPAATLVRRLDTQGSWAKVLWNGQEGWIPSPVIKLIP